MPIFPNFGIRHIFRNTLYLLRSYCLQTASRGSGNLWAGAVQRFSYGWKM